MFDIIGSIVSFILSIVYNTLRLCKHDYKIIHKISVYTSSHSKLPTYFTYVTQCKYCGKLKKYKV